MSNDDNDEQQDFPSRPQQQQNVSTTTATPRSFFALPPPLKRIFDQFPLVTYDANELPARAPKHREEHVLHVFTTEEDARRGRPSFNVGCLKWQTYLKFAKVPFRTVVSSNHASPTGVLPFLQPAGSDPQSLKGVEPVPGNKLKRWVGARKKMEEVEDVRYEAYASLLENRIRKAWLHQLYLTPSNTALAERLYVKPCSSNVFVQMAIIRQLRSAAELELIKTSGMNVISATDLYRDAEEAFEALSVLLGKDEWFFGQTIPGLFDASVFAYTQLILDDESLPWNENPLGEALSRHQNLVQHRERILQVYY